MKNRDFDHFIKQQLNSIQQGTDIPGWDSFESRLDREMKNDSFDIQIKESLESIQETYRESHWQLFLSRLAIVKVFTQDLIYNKAFEAFLFILVLAFIFPKTVQDYPTRTFVNISNEEYKFFENTASLKITEVKEYNGNYELFSEDEFFESSIPENSFFLGTADAQRHTTDISIQNKIDRPLISLLAPSRIVFLKTDDISAVDIESLPFEKKHPKVDNYPIDPIDPIAIMQLNLVSYCNDINLARHIPPAVYTGRKTVVSVFSTLDINTIHTPYDAIYLRNGYEQSKLGLGGGFSIGWAQNRWTFETGMVFSMKQYNPKSILEIFRFNPDEETAQAISLKAIELNTLSIPLHIRFDLHQGRKFTPYLLGGVGLNLATHANYEREQYAFAIARPIPQNAEVNTGSSPRLEEKKFEDGLIQGGSFKENYFLSLNSGLGLDYQIGRQWKLFTELNYHYNFLQKELGPNNDRINTFSFKLGARHIMYHKAEVAL